VISADGFRLSLDDGQEITLEELERVAEDYWNEWEAAARKACPTRSGPS